MTFNSTKLSVVCLLLCSFISNTTDAKDDLVKSTYTSIKESDCKNTTGKIAEKYTGNGVVAQECPGNGVWKVFFVSSETRSWLDIANGSKTLSMEEQVVYKNMFGNFPNIDGENVEWVANSSGVLSGLIFKVTAQDKNDAGKNVSRYFVVSLSKDNAIFCGTAESMKSAYEYITAKNKCTTILNEIIMK